MASRGAWLGLLLCLSLGPGCAQTASPVTARSGEESVEEEREEPVQFQDITRQSGVDFTYRNGEETANHLSILESLGGGAGLIDFDGDGRLDVFLPGGGGFAGTDKHDIVGYPCKLYKNLGGGDFRDVTTAAGLDRLAGGKPWFYTHAAAVADYDCDGWPDLLVTGWGAVALLHNVAVDPADPKKGRRFEDVTAGAGLGDGFTWATSAAFADLDGDGYPDLYVCQYVDWSWQKNPPCTYDGKLPDVCSPRQFHGLPHKLYHNSGRGTFLDVSKEARLKPAGPNASKGLGVLIVDVDGDGKPDIYVANDTVDKFLYLNRSERGRLHLDEVGLSSGTAKDDAGAANGSMGLDAGDPDHRGKPSLWVTNYENELPGLYRNDGEPGRPRFRFRTAASGIAAIGQQYVGWGTAFVDVDRDGWEDLVIVNGHAIRYPGGQAANRKQRPVLLHNEGEGRFRIASKRLGSYFQTPHVSRGVAFGDLDNDGRIDLVISHLNEPVAILRGAGSDEAHWLGVHLVGAKNVCIVGARVVLTTEGQRQTRFAKGGGSYLSSGDRRLLFGLGRQAKAAVTVTWPDGRAQRFEDLAVDRYHRIVQGQARTEAEPAAPLPRASR